MLQEVQKKKTTELLKSLHLSLFQRQTASCLLRTQTQHVTNDQKVEAAFGNKV